MVYFGLEIFMYKIVLMENNELLVSLRWSHIFAGSEFDVAWRINPHRRHRQWYICQYSFSSFHLADILQFGAPSASL